MITESAIIKEGIIYTGRRHHNIINDNVKQFFNGCEQGFITDTGEFVSREEALKIAIECNQIIKKCGNSEVLYSEDVW